VIKMQIMLCLLYVLAACKWADWQKWERCYPTFLFFLVADFFAMVLTTNHTLWLFYPTFLLPNHTLTDFCIAFVATSATLLLYLSRYPADGSMYKQAIWTGIFAAAYSLTELLTHSLGLLVYEHGWSLGWSAIFNVVMFSLLRAHYLKPGLAWALSVAFGLFIWIHFDFSLHGLK